MNNDTPTHSQLTPAESKSLQALEGVIKDGLAVFIDVGRALREIRDKRLYRAAYTNFEDYIEARWQMHVSQAKQLIVAAEVEEEVTLKTLKILAKSPLANQKRLFPMPAWRRRWRRLLPKGSGPRSGKRL
jgi:hypothetical protein